MGFEEFSALVQSVQLPVIGYMTPELALFGLSVAFFGFSTVVCAMAVNAANGARDAQQDARLMMRTTQDYAVEIRQLASRAEKIQHATLAHTEGLSDRIKGVRVGSRYDTEEADVDVADAETAQAAIEENVDAAASAAVEDEPVAEEDDANARLADATRAATEPRSLLSGILRRR